MPRPVAAGERYLPGLDGLRALAVIVVVGYHFRVPYLTGGLLGVGVFFTLSGFLITRILLSTLANRGISDCASSGSHGHGGCCLRWRR